MATRPDITAPNRMDDARRTLMDTIQQFPLSQLFSRAVLKAAETLAARSQDWSKPLAWFQPEGGHADALQCGVMDPDGVSQRVTVYLYPCSDSQGSNRIPRVARRTACMPPP
ncbi:hypothetical protein [Rhodanobacter lindaniclasticus]